MRPLGGPRSYAENIGKCELAAEVLRSFGALRFAATGWSMLPTIWPGETLVVESVDPEQVRIGDIVLIGRDHRLCAHRVVRKAGDLENPQWITQGDAMAIPDPSVSQRELLGRVAYVMRDGNRTAVRSGLGVIDKLAAGVVRRSYLAARALVYLNGIRRTSRESVLPCQG
jgi:signal peptidase I